MRYRCISCLLSLSSLALAANVCQIQRGQDHYDLSSLVGASDYEIPDGNNKTINLSICRSVQTEVYGGNIEDKTNVGVYRDAGSNGEALGAAHDDPVVLDPPEGEPNSHALRIVYPPGTACPAGGRYSSLLLPECDAAVYGTGHPILAGTGPKGCTFFFVWRTAAACPKPPSRGILSAILVFLSVGLIAVLVFFASSVAYNRLVLKKRGADQFPPLPANGGSFLGGLKDRFSGLADNFRSRDRAYFRGLPNEDGHEQEHTSLFDDLDDDE